MTEFAVEATELSKRFLLASERRTSLKERFVRGRAPAPRAFWALKDATFSVPKGSALGIIGHNGSGKSTALKVLTGIYRPTSGTVKVNGSFSALLEVGAGFHPELTGRENIRLNATILGFSNREIDRVMDQIVEFADIGDHIDSPLKHYSSGMHVRLGFAVAVMVRPEILIVDEVISVGDEEFQRKCFDYLRDLRRAGSSMIIVSHGLGQVTDLCDDAVWLERGEVQEFGPARDVVHAYVELVNEREALRQPHSGEVPGDDALRAARHGSGEIRVTRVEVVDDVGRPVPVPLPGARLTFNLHYEAHEEIPNAVFGLGFRHESGVFASGPNSARTGGWRIPQGSGCVSFAVDSLHLQPGTFSIISAVVDQGHTFDYVEPQMALRIRTTGSDEPGLVRMDGEWSMRTGEAGPAVGTQEDRDAERVEP